MNLLKLRAKRMLVCLLYIGALDQGSVPALGVHPSSLFAHLD